MTVYRILEGGLARLAIREDELEPPPVFNMTPEAFETGGYLQETNRRLLHGLGLHLEVRDGQLVIVDARRHAVGLEYAPGKLRQVLADKVNAERMGTSRVRAAAYGHQVQPLPRASFRAERASRTERLGSVADITDGGRV